MHEGQTFVFAFLLCFARVPVGSGMIDDVLFEPSSVRQLEVENNRSVTVWTNRSLGNLSLCAFSSKTDVADVSETPLEFELAEDGSHSKYKSSFTIHGKFLGYSSVRLGTCATNNSDNSSSNSLSISVISNDDGMDKFFIGTIAILMFLIYINFGCALDLIAVEKALKKPVGIIIGLVSQFVFMPLMSFVAARLLFSANPALQLGLFFTGCSPGGTGSNLWTLVLDGNVDLSVTMTAVSTFISIVTIPFWVFTLGRVIFDEAEIGIPYERIGITAFTLIVPLLIGIYIQCKLPKMAKFLVKALKPFAAFMIVYVIVATYSKAFLYKFLNWTLLMACISNPLLGYLFGALVAKLFRQGEKDVMAISIETGIQNVAIAILLLKTTLARPESDISEVVPLTTLITTQVPLGLLLMVLTICKRVRERSGETEVSAVADFEAGVPLTSKQKPNIVKSPNDVRTPMSTEIKSLNGF